MIVTCLVTAVLICDTCQQALLSHAVSSMAEPSLLTVVVKTSMVQVFFGCAIATLVQQLDSPVIMTSMLISSQILLLANLQEWLERAGCWLAQCRNTCVQISLLSEVISLKTIGIVFNTFSVVTDITISVVLVILLHASKTGFKRSTDLLNRLSDKYEVGRLYTNSILVTLNSREYIKSASMRATEEHYSLEPSMPSALPDAIEIRIDRNTTTGNDFQRGSDDVKNPSGKDEH
ncbi:hypothetical protein C8R43DRAFT_962603 [Mycena crocata]|nr:hypothetical protein C8R43DRAFT_962603 [Mycena crocata]